MYAASQVRSAWYRTLLGLFQRFDFLLLPSAQAFPFDVNVHWPTHIAGVEMDTYHRWRQVAVPATMAGCPAISRPRADLDVLRLAAAYEQATAWLAMLPAALG